MDRDPLKFLMQAVAKGIRVLDQERRGKIDQLQQDDARRPWTGVNTGLVKPGFGLRHASGESSPKIH